LASTNGCRPADRSCPGGTRCGAALVAVLLGVALTACGGPPVRRDGGSVSSRLPGETPVVAPAAPATPPLSVADIVALHRSGASAEAVVRRWREDGARTRFSAGDLIELHTRGVPLSTLDALIDARETALRTDADSRLAALQAHFNAELAAERARPGLCPSPWPGYPFSPYGGWRRGPRGGLYWGW